MEVRWSLFLFLLKLVYELYRIQRLDQVARGNINISVSLTSVRANNESGMASDVELEKRMVSWEMTECLMGIEWQTGTRQTHKSVWKQWGNSSSSSSHVTVMGHGFVKDLQLKTSSLPKPASDELLFKLKIVTMQALISDSQTWAQLVDWPLSYPAWSSLSVVLVIQYSASWSFQKSNVSFMLHSVSKSS